MSEVITINPHGFASNCYLITPDGKYAVAIDPAQPRILKEAEKRGLIIKYVLLTHGHFDHIGGCAALQAAGAQIGCLDVEKDLALYHNLGPQFGFGEVPPFTVDFTFRNGDVLQLLGMRFTVLATPGHTAGSCCFLTDGAIFSGDTLFAGDIGRTDLPTGSMREMVKSLAQLAALEQNDTLYPGHGMPTTLEEERLHGGLRP